jgi:hypothetical protein
MIADDDGPFFIFKRIRYWALDHSYWEMIQKGINPNVDATTDRWFGKWHNLSEGLSCAYCSGVWISAPLFLMWLYPTYLGDLFLMLMSISGGQAFLQSLKK